MNITNNMITEYLHSFYEPLDDDMRLLRKKCEKDGIPLILKETEDFLSFLIKLIQPKRILEIGTAYGYSSLFFYKTLDNALITSIELDKSMYDIATGTIKRNGGADNIRVINGDALDVLDDLKKDLTKDQYFDFVFIDASKSHYEEFFKKAEKLCTSDALIVCDNILMKASIVDKSLDQNNRHRTNVKRMKEFLYYINERKDVDQTIISSGDGLALIKLHD